MAHMPPTINPLDAIEETPSPACQNSLAAEPSLSRVSGRNLASAKPTLREYPATPF